MKKIKRNCHREMIDNYPSEIVFISRINLSFSKHTTYKLFNISSYFGHENSVGYFF